MKRLLVDALLIGAVAFGAWTVRGEAVREVPVAYGDDIRLVCSSGELVVTQLHESAVALTLTIGSGDPRFAGVEGMDGGSILACTIEPE